MAKNLPNLKKDKYKICIICEGLEEKKYLEKLIKLKVWHESYGFKLVNAEGNGNISSKYQYYYNSDTFNIVLIFCDVDSEYENIKFKINKIHNNPESIIIFSNPCTMQIVIKHWVNENIKTASKKINAKIIKQCTGVNSYEGTDKQIENMMQKITKENYYQMKERLLDKFTNFKRFIIYFENSNSKWIDELNKKIE